MSLQIRTEGPVRVIAIDRPERRNAVDGPTAAELADAFRAFDADEDARVAVSPAPAAFCAGADLKAIAERGNRRRAEWRRPDGTDPPGAVQAGDRRHRGARGRGRPRARALVRPAGRRGRGRGARRVLPALGRAADRRRDDPAAAPHRAEPRDGPDPHRPGGRPRRRWRSGWSTGGRAARRGAAGGDRAGQDDRRASRRRARGDRVGATSSGT